MPKNSILENFWKYSSSEFTPRNNYARGLIGYDGFKKILGTKVHVAVESNGLPVSIVTSPANEHDSTRFIDVMKSISDFLDDKSIQQIISVYADKGYDNTSIRNYLKKIYNSFFIIFLKFCMQF